MRSSRWYPYLLTATLSLCLALLLVTRANSQPPPLSAQIADQQVSTWRCQDYLGWKRTKSSVSPWALPRSHAYRQWVLRTWTQRHGICRAALAEQKRQWNWQAWLPAIWRAIGMCETQLNWQHNSGTYQGAFGFYHGSWDAFRPSGYPTEAYLASPWQQYQVALRIYARYGFSGWGCYTHGGYRYHL